MNPRIVSRGTCRRSTISGSKITTRTRSAGVPLSGAYYPDWFVLTPEKSETFIDTICDVVETTCHSSKNVVSQFIKEADYKYEIHKLKRELVKAKKWRFPIMSNLFVVYIVFCLFFSRIHIR